MRDIKWYGIFFYANIIMLFTLCTPSVRDENAMSIYAKTSGDYDAAALPGR